MSYLGTIVNDLQPILTFVSPLAMAGIFLAFLSKFIKG